MSKELIPLRVEDITELKKPLNPQVYEPVVPESTTTKVWEHLSGFTAKNIVVYTSSWMGLSASPILINVGLVSFVGIDLGIGPTAVMSMLGLVSGLVVLMSDITPGQKRRNKKYKAVYDAILDKNFQAFLRWAKLRYNINIDADLLPEENLTMLKQAFSNISSLSDKFAWVKDTMGKTYLVRKSNSGNYYLVEETSDEVPTTVVLTEVRNKPKKLEPKKIFEAFTGESLSLWDALQSRLTTIENFGLSVENAHTIQRVQNDCVELTSNIYKLSKLNVEPNFEELEKALVGLNQEVQDVIDDEANIVKKEITKTTDWITVRNMKMDKNLTADQLSILPTSLLKREGNSNE